MMFYNYTDATSRNIGWISEWEQLALRCKKVAIAGMGGVGGAHLITLTRLGIGRFHIADLDTFEVANFNRQIGATMKTLQKDKAETLAAQAKEINPDLHIQSFPKGITEDNIDAFLQDVDVFVDGFDFFVLDIRAKVFQRCWELGIPAVTAAPIGMGTAFLTFLPGKMSFETYFRLQGKNQAQQYVNFAVGLTPKGFHRHYLIDPTRLDLVNKRGPSTIMAVNLCAGVLATEVLKLLVKRGKVYPAPYYHQFDAFTGQFTRGKLRYGNHGLLQRLKCKIGLSQFQKLSEKAITPNPEHYASSIIEQILDLARWAPSGDNEQPWHFEIQDESNAVILCQDTRDHCVYDLHGHASELALGALLESARIASTVYAKQIEVKPIELGGSKSHYALKLSDAPELPCHPLAGYIPLRCTQRRPYTLKSISQEEKAQLQKAVGSHYSILWLETFSDRLKMARLVFASAHIRLTIPEAYSVHKSIIAWDQAFSTTKIPDQAVGLDQANLKLMKWVLSNWSRVTFFNRFLAGTIVPRIQLEFIPAIFCGAHYLLVSKQPMVDKTDYIAGGGAVQRFWLTATQLGLEVQPEMTPLIFTQYVDDEIDFTQSNKAIQEAHIIQSMLNTIVGEPNRKQAVFMGRIGVGNRPNSRSTRKPLHRLLSKR